MAAATMITPEAFTKARVLAEKLMTTCAPNEHWEELDELSRDECLALDTIAFECQTCNHWFPIAQQHDVQGRFLCKDCV